MFLREFISCKLYNERFRVESENHSQMSCNFQNKLADHNLKIKSNFFR